MDELSASQQIDAIIAQYPDWRGAKLRALRAVITSVSPEITEEIKWRKPSRPEGVPVWSHEGTICVADVLKNAVRLTFPAGAKLPDPSGLFNTRLDSKTVRAIDMYQDSEVDEQALRALIVAALESSTS